MSNNKEWILCANWLVDCQVLMRDNKAAQSTATIQDLTHALRDGVLICLLLNRLRPKTLDPKDFSQRPQLSQFLCVKNIKVFLQACKNVFGLSEADLFTAPDLFESRDIKRVISTLSALSQTPLALASNIPPFVLTNNNNGSSSQYINLDTMNDGEDAEESDSDGEEYYTIVSQNEEEEDVYGEFVAVKRSSSRLNDSHNHHAPQAVSTLPKTKLEMCLNELMDTEKNYVTCLEMITQQFMGPLRAVIKPQDFDKIFRHVEKLYETHRKFCEELKNAHSKQSTHTIADCFITNKEQFLIYGEFCSNLIAAQDLLDRVCQNDPKIQQCVYDLQMKANEGRFKLRDLLSVPMQRVLKYHLLLKELIKHTDADDSERKSLQRALDETQDLSLFVNEVKRDNETLNALSLLQQSIADLPLPNGMNLKDYGRLLMDGELKVKSTASGNGQRHVFVLDRLIIICKAGRGSDFEYAYNSSLTVKKFDLDENISKDWTIQQGNTYWFTMTDRTAKETFSFGAKKEDLVNKWIGAIKMAKDNICPPYAVTRQHEFSMESFNEPTICDVCRKLLRGVFLQGYKCAKTKMNVHKECLEKAKDMAGPPTVIPPKLPSRPSFKQPCRTLKGKVIAISNYNGTPPPIGNRPPLQFDKGDSIDLYSEDGEFYEGHLNGREGFFPRSFVQKRPNRFGRQGISYEEVSGADSLSPLPANNSSFHSRVDAGEPTNYKWYVSRMSREEATSCLDSVPDGTFLIRLSVNDSRKGEYALSIRFDGQPKHIKIQRNADGSFSLAACHLFQTITELVEYYQDNSLERLFPEVKTTLALPYKDAVLQQQQQRRCRQSSVANNASNASSGSSTSTWCEAIYDYAATAPNQISLREHDRIEIISRAGEANGWWKGNNKGKIGYFPYTYVRDIEM